MARVKISPVSKHDEDGYELVLEWTGLPGSCIGIQADAEILAIDDRDVDDAKVCFATEQADLCVSQDMLRALHLALTQWFTPGKRVEVTVE